jgi:hypothetical protein
MVWEWLPGTSVSPSFLYGSQAQAQKHQMLEIMASLLKTSHVWPSAITVQLPKTALCTVQTVPGAWPDPALCSRGEPGL